MGQYATAQELKEWLADKVSYVQDADGASIDAMLTDVLKAASDDIDAGTGRVFYRTNGQAREFYVDEVGIVHVKDLIASTTPTIQIDQNGDDVVDTTLAATDYVLGPRTDDRGLPAVRYQMIRPSRAGSVGFLPGRLMKVTGDWGYVGSDDDEPPQVRRACILRAARLIARRDARLGSMVMTFGAGTMQLVAKLDHDYEQLIEPLVWEGYAVT